VAINHNTDVETIYDVDQKRAILGSNVVADGARVAAPRSLASGLNTI
jgi:hypothetical protein